MSYAMLVLGSLEVPPGEWKRYLKLVVDPARREDWVGNLSVHSRSEPRTVAQLVEWLSTGVSVWLKIDTRGSRLAVQGVLAEDPFYEVGVNLAEVFRVAADVGGRGELAFMEEQAIPSGERLPEECYLVEVSPGKTTVGYIPVERQRLILVSEPFKELARAVLASLDDETRTVFEAEMAKHWKRLARLTKSPGTRRRSAGAKPKSEITKRPAGGKGRRGPG
jgi:hypothetical protein